MKCQNLFSGENKKNISTFRLLKNLPRMVSIKVVLTTYKQLLRAGDFNIIGNHASIENRLYMYRIFASRD